MYIDCSDETQVDGVLRRSFADLDNVVLLVIDTDLLTSPWRAEQLDGADQLYPHIYGPLNLNAVTEVREL